MLAYNHNAAFYDIDPRLSLDINSSCSIYSRSKKQWLPGVVNDIFIDPNTNQEWLIVKYGNNKSKRIQRLCNDLQADYNDLFDPYMDAPYNDDNEMKYEINDARMLLDIGSPCEIYSRSKNKWYNGTISDIFIDRKTNQEWLVIKYGKNKSKKIQRLCDDLQIAKDDLEVDEDEKLPHDMYTFFNVNSYGDEKNEIEEFKVPEIEANERRIDPELLKKLIGKWRQYQSPRFPATTYSKMIGVNSQEFIVATENFKQTNYTLDNMDMFKKYGLYKYNVLEDTWLLLMLYPSSLPSLSDIKCLTLNPSSNELYVYGHTKSFMNDVMFKINLDTFKVYYKLILYIVLIILHFTSLSMNKYGHLLFYFVVLYKQYKVDSMDYIKDYHSSYGSFRNNSITSCFMMNNLYHTIGIHDDDEKEKIVCSSWDISKQHGIRLENELFEWNHGKEHLPKNVLWIKSLNQLFFYHHVAGMWMMDLVEQKWKRIKIRIPFNQFGGQRETPYVITSDDKYIIFIEHALFFLDLDTMKFYGSASIQLPLSKSINFGVLIMPYCTDDEAKVVTYGYIKDCVLDKNGYFRFLIPMDIINLISIYWTKDFIYILDKDQNNPNLWGMCVDDILDQSVSNLYEVYDQ